MKSMQRTCPKCGKVFVVSLKKSFKKGRVLYCSRNCLKIKRKYEKHGHGYEDKIYVKSYFKRNPHIKFAHAKLQYAVSVGKIERKPCEVCGTTNCIQAHHDDYSQPYNVRWLCRDHHRKLHGLQNPKAHKEAA